MTETGWEPEVRPELELPDFYTQVFGPNPEIYNIAQIQNRPAANRLDGMIFMVEDILPHLKLIEAHGGQVLWDGTMVIDKAAVATCADPKLHIFTVVEKMPSGVIKATDEI